MIPIEAIAAGMAYRRKYDRWAPIAALFRKRRMYMPPAFVYEARFCGTDIQRREAADG